MGLHSALRGTASTPPAILSVSTSLLPGLLGVWQVCHSPLQPAVFKCNKLNMYERERDT